MILASDNQYEIHVWVKDGDNIVPVRGEHVAALLAPIIVVRPLHLRLTPQTPTPMIYENRNLYFFYKDASTGEYIKEPLVLMRDAHKQMLQHVENLLSALDLTRLGNYGRS